VIHYNGNASRAQDVVSSIEALGVKAVAVQADAASENFGDILVNAALNSFETSNIDIVVNCAGTIVMASSIQDIDIASWDKAFQINARSAFLLIQAAVPHMPKGGRIVNIGSIAAKMGSRHLAVFAASKAALSSLTVSLAEELGPKEITINIVAPGPIITEPEVADPADLAPVATKIFNNAHIKRPGSTEEVAEAVKWLVSPLSGYVTGQLIPVDGGAGWP
jgi:NAD(P)-dependent dehydrogenase (short-subunit alcohol dehydrogenase family)